MPDFHLSLTFRVIFFLLAAGCSAALSIFIYRVTVPPIASALRFFLMALRGVGLFLLFFILGEPILSLITHSIDQPTVAILVDNSQSMTMRDRTGSRIDELKSVINSSVWQQLKGKANVSYILFDARTRPLSSITEDSLTLKGEATDIAGALKEIKRMSETSNLQAAVLVTDGNSTLGINPLYDAEELGMPVFDIGIGDTNEQKDLLIRKVLTNEITYVGIKVPVNITVHSSGYGGERVQVLLRDETTTFDKKLLTLETGTRDYLIPFTFVPDKEGTQKFIVEISHLPDELTYQNNQMRFFTKVLRSKLHIILIAGAPNEDVAFIRRMLANDKNIDSKIFIERKDDQFYEGTLTQQVLNNADCLLLIGYPTTHTSLSNLQFVLNAAMSEKPLLLVLSRTIDFEKLHILDPILPFSVQNVSGNELQVFASIPDAQRTNPILRTGTGVKTVDAWSKLPPIFQLQGSFWAKPETEILAAARFRSMSLNNPLIVSRNVNREKTLAVLGYGLWQWKLLSDGGTGTEQLIDDFISNALRWLTTREDERRIRINTSKELFTSQEPVEFFAQIYDENYTPINDAQIEVRTDRHGETNLTTLDPLGNGQYQGTIDRLQEGDYKFEGRVILDGKEIGRDRGTFSVGSLHAEYLETRMNISLLQQIAVHTGGKYYNPYNFGTLANDICSLPNFKPKELSKVTEYDLWNSRWMLGLAIFFFALEWFIRKWSGML